MTNIQMPDLKLTAEKSIFESITFKEQINESYLDKLIVSDHLNTVSWMVGNIKIENEKTQLLKMKNKLLKDGILKVKYAKTSMKYGRVYANQGNSLGSLRKEIRQTLCKDIYTDYNHIKNILYVIILKIKLKLY